MEEELGAKWRRTVPEETGKSVAELRKVVRNEQNGKKSPISYPKNGYYVQSVGITQDSEFYTLRPRKK